MRINRTEAIGVTDGELACFVPKRDKSKSKGLTIGPVARTKFRNSSFDFGFSLVESFRFFGIRGGIGMRIKLGDIFRVERLKHFGDAKNKMNGRTGGSFKNTTFPRHNSRRRCAGNRRGSVISQHQKKGVRIEIKVKIFRKLFALLNVPYR